MTQRFSLAASSTLGRCLLGAVTVAGLAGALAGCAPLLIGGAAVGAVAYQDRRTSGTQVDDQSIEFKAGNRAKEVLGDRGHVNVTSYNRTVLVTGEVPNEADKAAVEAAIAKIENVRGVLNELAVGFPSSLVDRSNDALITSKVKASYVDAKDIFASAYKVVTERSIVYLMGRVTPREADRGVAIARGVPGVAKVVKAFEIISEDELAGYKTAPAPAPAASTAR